MAYTQNFVSLKGTTYTLTISNVSGVTLPLAATPFETEEDDDVNVFTPVRTQSGYIRMIVPNAASRAQWQSCIPSGATAMPVRLTHVSNDATVIDWQGYVQTGTYGMPYPADYEEFELPVVCPLSVLETIDIDTDDKGVKTFGWLLNYIFGKVTTAGTTISKYYIQGSPSVVNARLALKVIWANFLDTDSHGTIEAKYNCYQVLEEVCKFFGYSCRICGDAVYFTCPAGGSAAFTEFTTLTGTGTAASAGTFDVTYAMLATTNHNETVEPGMNRVTVSSDINKLDNLIEIPYDELFDQYFIGQSSIICRSVDNYERGVYCAVKEPNANTQNLEYEDDNVYMKCYMATVPGVNKNGGSNKKYCRFFVYDDSDVGDLGGTPPESKQSYSWKKCVELFHSWVYPQYGEAGSDNTPMFTIRSKRSFIVSDGYLYINFNCDEVSAWIGIVKFTAQLKIGDKYWAGGGWSTNASAFDMYFNSEGVKTTRQSVNDPQYKGWGIPVTDTMRGVIEFCIIDVPWWERLPFVPKMNGFLPLMDFEIGFVRGTIEETRHTGNEYTVQSGGQFQGTETVDLIFACDVVYGPQNYQRHMPAGLGYVLNGSNEKPVATIPALSGTSLSAEQKLAQIMAAYHSHTHRCVELELWSNMVSVTPIMTSAGLETMHPLSISHSWRDDITRVKLIQI